MLRHLRRLLLSLTAVVAAWWLYALVVVPWIDPQATRPVSAGSSAEPAGAAESAVVTQTAFQRRLTELFRPGAWELDQPKVLETDQGVFLFREYRELSDQRFEIKPCTLVAFSQAGIPLDPDAAEAPSAAGRVIVLQAPQGAQLQFDDTSDLQRFKFGKLLGGRLPGEIKIWSREPDGADAFELTTRNIQIEERRIWTPHDVKFRFGESHGSGRDLEIRLQRTVAPGDAPDSAAVNSTLGNLHSVELVHLDELHLEGLADDSRGAPSPSPDLPAPPAASPTAAPTASPTASSPTSGPAEPPGQAAASRPGDSGLFDAAGGPIDIACRGPVRFNVVDFVATLEEEVSVVRQTPGQAPDRLNCDLLTVVLRQRQAITGEPNPSARRRPRFEVERLIASGEAVDLQAPTQKASARGRRLEIDLPGRRLRLEGESGVQLRHETVEIDARHLEYELPSNRGELGRAWAQGPGRLTGRFGATSSPPCVATWGDELQLRPHEGLQVVSLTGGATIEYGSAGRFASESLHLWLRNSRGRSGEPGRTARDDWRPDRLLAQGDVTLQARQLAARTRRVEAWFRDADGAAGPGVLVSDGGAGPTNAPPSPGFGLGGESTSGGTPFEVQGELVRVALLRQPSGAVELDALEVLDQVRIRELPSAAGAGSPSADSPPSGLDVRGDRLRLEQAAAGKGLLRVVGQPASVTARGMTLVGAEVQLDQASNSIRIPGPGEMSLPPFDLKSRPKTGVLYESPVAPAASASVGRPTVVSWKNGLEFDGQSAKFSQDVQVRASQRLANGEWLDLLLLGGDLEVRLTSRVLFSDAEGRPVAPTLDTLRFTGSVYVDGRTHQGDLLTSYERLQVRNLTLHQATGRLTGEGPGWLAGLRRDDGSLGAPTAGAGPAAGIANAPPGAPKILFLHVSFQQGMEGRLQDRQIDFLQQVRTIFGPVPDWDSEIDPNRPEEWPADAVELRCDRLSVAQHGGATPDTAAAELSATGNATVEGRKFGARAARISYTQAKELLVLAGDGRSDAEFWKKPRTQTKPDAAATTIMFWRRDGRVSVSGVKYVDLNSIGP